MNIIKILLCSFIILALNACNKDNTFGFTSGNCNEVYTACMNKCTQANKTRSECINNCDKSRSMCEAVKTKGCMQNCNKNYGKKSQQAEVCKQQCMNNRGVSY
ncbi:hypothetical protein [Helicobacter sp. MIT 14-3879]|uniref:hypothetical protein n=1 Tax=Helicobacter sp. MIT 14-3879 TaxID=2040649 RepID=UPI000E1E50AE|nr:hypothetical protein [Helicobacter sp. MIT 14-3879]RDU65539.1 hypothetical protein CQA44_00690 [Helicobacter sp. MIT 14-3879]